MRTIDVSLSLSLRRSLRIGNISVTHTHSAFTHRGPYILRGRRAGGSAICR